MRKFALRFILLLAIAGTAQFSQAQIEWMPKSIGKKKWKPELGFDSRRSFFNDRNVRFLGLKLGIEWRGVHSAGLSAYSMTKGQEYRGIAVDRVDAALDSKVKFEAGFSTLYYERVIMKTGELEVSVPLYLGGGELRGSYEDLSGTFKPFLKEDFSVLGFGLMGRYKLLPWLEPGLGFGYRVVYNTTSETRRTLQQPYYTIKVRILVIEAIKGFFSDE